jgi:hypothetical protein
MDAWQLSFFEEVLLTFFIIFVLPFGLVFGAVWLGHRDEAAARSASNQDLRQGYPLPDQSPRP